MRTLRSKPSVHPALDIRTAADLMTPNPVSLRENATLQEAVTLLTDRGFSAAPVINAAGHPVGVVSHTDIVVHDRESGCMTRTGTYSTDEDSDELPGPGFHIEHPDRARVCDIMTSVVFSIAPETPASRIVADLVALKVHRLYVVDRQGVLVGVVTALDVLRCLCPEPQ